MFGVELDDIIKSRPDWGVVLHDNDMLLAPSKILPPPETRGSLTKVFIRGNQLSSIIFGRGSAGAPTSPKGNYIWFRGGTIRFGKLTMSDADLRADRHASERIRLTSFRRNTAGSWWPVTPRTRPSKGCGRTCPTTPPSRSKPGGHSWMRVRAGSIRAARRAGRYADSIAIVSSPIVTAAYVWKSNALIP